jgi:hypothetical protein
MAKIWQVTTVHRAEYALMGSDARQPPVTAG